MDIDGTIIDHSRHLIPPKTLETIRRLAQENVIWLCTGRVYLSAKIDLGVKIDNYISALGTQIYKDDKLIYERPFTDKELKDITKRSKDAGLEVIYEGAKHGYSTTRYQNSEERRLPFEANYQYWLKDDDYDGEKIFKLLIREVSNDKERLNHFIEENRNDYEFCLSTNKDIALAEISPKGQSKGEAILQLSKMGLFDMKDTICIGDSPNDVSMFKVCAASIAMGQGREEVKAQALYVTDSVSDDGFYKAFAHLKMVN